jgi:uncharacterized protein (TIGR03382 family)
MVLIAASGTAEAAPAISIEPQTPLEFRSAASGNPGDAPGAPQFGFFMVRNTGKTKLQVKRMEITGPDAAIMAFNGDFDPFCGSGRVCAQNFTLEAGEVRGFQTLCTPTQPGVFSASLIVTGNVAHQQASAAMVCVGNHPPVIAVSPSGLDFGVAHYCFPGDLCGPSCATAPSTQTLTITNSAPAPSELEFYFAGIDLGPFGHVTMTPGDLAIAGRHAVLRAGESATFQFTFAPRSGVVINTLQLVSLFPGQPPVTIPFHAIGGSGQLVLDPPDFPTSVEYGHTFLTTLTARNDGDSCLEVTQFSSSGMCEPVGDGPAPLRVAPGETFSRTFLCIVDLLRYPTTTVEIECPHESHDINNFMFSVDPSGGALISFSEAVEFTGPQEVAVGASATLQFQIYNLGSDPAELVAITSTDSQFTATPAAGSLPISIPFDESALIDVTFTPTHADRTSGTLTLGVSRGLGVVQAVVGDGVIGVAGQPAISTRQLTFGADGDPEIAARAAAERGTRGGCQTGDAGSLAPIAGLAGLFVRRRRRGSRC